MRPGNHRTNPTSSKFQSWIKKTFCADYFRRFELTLTLCLTVYLVFLLVTRGPVDMAVLAVFVPTSGVAQVFFGQEKLPRKSSKTD